jgi:hypothetical protein
MDTKEILHRLFQGMDQYAAYGVPDPVLALVIDLTREVYGDPGVSMLRAVTAANDQSVTSEPVFAHTLKIDPLALIQGLESLPVWSRTA